MELGKFSIDWKDFEALATKRFKDLVGKPEFSDVTLVLVMARGSQATSCKSSDGFYHCQYCERHLREGSNMKRHIRKRHQKNSNIPV